MSTRHFFNKEINRSKLAIRWCPIRLLRFKRFEFVSLRFVGRLFFVMKMSFKFDAAKKFFRVLFDSEFIFFLVSGTKFKPFPRIDFSGSERGKSSGIVTTL